MAYLIYNLLETRAKQLQETEPCCEQYTHFLASLFSRDMIISYTRSSTLPHPELLSYTVYQLKRADLFSLIPQNSCVSVSRASKLLE